MSSTIASNVWTATVVPILGVIAASAVVLAPFPQVWSVRKTKQLSTLNPYVVSTPLLVVIVSVRFGLIFKHTVCGWLYVITPNIIGFTSSGFYLRTTYLLTTPRSQRLIDLITSVFPVVLFSTFTALLVFPAFDLTTTLGWFSIVALVTMYGSPLSTMVSVCKSRNAVSLHPGFAVTSLLNGALWTVYGFVINDPFVYGPNCLGAVFATLQLLCMLVFGRNDSVPTTPTPMPHQFGPLCVPDLPSPSTDSEHSLIP